jgi:hypothetical protein
MSAGRTQRDPSWPPFRSRHQAAPGGVSGPRTQAGTEARPTLPFGLLVPSCWPAALRGPTCRFAAGGDESRALDRRASPRSTSAERLQEGLVGSLQGSQGCGQPRRQVETDRENRV